MSVISNAEIQSSGSTPFTTRVRAETFLIVHYSEVGLKGRNQPRFRNDLRENLYRKLLSAQLDWPVTDRRGALSIAVPAAEIDRVAEALANVREVAGVAWCAEAGRLFHGGFAGGVASTDFERLRTALVKLAHRYHQPGRTFCVRVNRGFKPLPFRSIDFERVLGEVIRQETLWKTVNLCAPDFTFHIDVQARTCDLFTSKIRGPAGLPVGTAGRVLALLSGGIDSPVAAWMMARRGCNVDFLHFTATEEQQTDIRKSKIWRIARTLCKITLGSRLYLVPYTRFDAALLGHRVKNDLVLFRRFMLRGAARLARQLKADALVTGDSLSQVASQTLSNLVATTSATGMPVFRPLVGFNKEEIVRLAEQIGTYPASVEPYKDCCALISRHPKTRSKHEHLEEVEGRIFRDYDQLVEDTLADAAWFELPCTAATLPFEHSPE